MKSNALGTLEYHGQSHRRRVKNQLTAKYRFPKLPSGDRNNPNAGKSASEKIMKPQKADDKGGHAATNSLWLSKIGDRIVGTVRLVQDNPRSVRIVLFRIDPEWSHTHIAVNLIKTIQEYCRDNGGLEVTLSQHVVPPWLHAIMNHHGFKFVSN
jgi:hypothetical protein